MPLQLIFVSDVVPQSVHFRCLCLCLESVALRCVRPAHSYHTHLVPCQPIVAHFFFACCTLHLRARACSSRVPALHNLQPALRICLSVTSLSPPLSQPLPCVCACPLTYLPCMPPKPPSHASLPTYHACTHAAAPPCPPTAASPEHRHAPVPPLPGLRSSLHVHATDLLHAGSVS